MNLNPLFKSVTLIAAITLAIESTYATNPANTWRDTIRLTAAGKYKVTTGTWTMNGFPIGTTWDTGMGGPFSVSGPGVHFQEIRFPPGIVPNDFHYSGDTWTPLGGVESAPLSGDFYWGSYSDPLVIPVLASASGASLQMVMDWTVSPSDPHLQLYQNGSPLYFGPMSGFNPSAFDLVVLGDRPLSRNTPHATFCSGDGSGTLCPCGNNSAPGAGEGCLNSLGQGGLLQAGGVASVSADSLVLTGSQMPNSFVLYFQGTQQHNGGNGSVFGDGLRCAGGSLIRLDVELNSGGTSQYPGGGDPSVSVKGAVPAGGGMRTYQAWYRDAVPYCTPATFNLTNGVIVNWTP